MCFKIQICFLTHKSVFQNTNPFDKHNYVHRRHESDTDTTSTDIEHTCGGLGKFEYSGKALPHALLHMPELVMRGGHHGAFCTFLAEVAHKYNIKMPAKLSRTYGSLNATQEQMLVLMLTQEIYTAAIDASTTDEETVSENSAGAADHSDCTRKVITRSAADNLTYMDTWSRIVGVETINNTWEDTFLSPKVCELNLTCVFTNFCLKMQICFSKNKFVVCQYKFVF